MAENTIAADTDVRKHLKQINLHLHLVRAGIILSAEALRHRNGEHNEDIAGVLTHCVRERLEVQMERITEVIEQLEETEDAATASCH